MFPGIKSPVPLAAHEDGVPSVASLSYETLQLFLSLLLHFQAVQQEACVFVDYPVLQDLSSASCWGSPVCGGRKSQVTESQRNPAVNSIYPLVLTVQCAFGQGKGPQPRLASDIGTF